ncbi:MAG: hypothetical protein ACPGWR_24500 [Ardenticatenaceae bacterium]
MQAIVLRRTQKKQFVGAVRAAPFQKCQILPFKHLSAILYPNIEAALFSPRGAKASSPVRKAGGAGPEQLHPKPQRGESQ